MSVSVDVDAAALLSDVVAVEMEHAVTVDDVAVHHVIGASVVHGAVDVEDVIAVDVEDVIAAAELEMDLLVCLFMITQVLLVSS